MRVTTWTEYSLIISIHLAKRGRSGNGPVAARELAEHLAGSRDAHAAFVEQLFHHLVQQPVAAYGAGLLDELVDAFEQHEFNIRRLAEEIMVATALVGRETESSRNELE